MEGVAAAVAAIERSLNTCCSAMRSPSNTNTSTKRIPEKDVPSSHRPDKVPRQVTVVAPEPSEPAR
ncbi:hypothetical protein ACFQV8_13655 [Pseudonocardia benzenivorans]